MSDNVEVHNHHVVNSQKDSAEMLAQITKLQLHQAAEIRRTKAETLKVIHSEIEHLVKLGVVDGPVDILEHILARHREIEAAS